MENIKYVTTEGVNGEFSCDVVLNDAIILTRYGKSYELASRLAKKSYLEIKDERYPIILTISQTAPSDYPESNWEINTAIKNDICFIKALKKAYLHDAKTRNDYPVVSHPVRMEIAGRMLDKTIYPEVFEKFDRWTAKIKSLIPRLRKNKREIDKITGMREVMFRNAEEIGYECREIQQGSDSQIKELASRLITTLQSNQLDEIELASVNATLGWINCLVKYKVIVGEEDLIDIQNITKTAESSVQQNID